MIYSFYEPDHESRAGLGTYIILDHIRRAAAEDLPYVYLGYWVEGSARMQYKVRYRPLEKLSRDGWQRFTEDEQTRLVDQVAAARHVCAVPGAAAKDGVSPLAQSGVVQAAAGEFGRANRPD
jgi:arginine-tRNA-protein transferase